MSGVLAFFETMLDHLLWEKELCQHCLGIKVPLAYGKTWKPSFWVFAVSVVCVLSSSGPIPPLNGLIARPTTDNF